ncbi:MAG TPA: hypothetical protein VFF04_00220 [Candidatus Babeliales bacterium]|nr:hypothetical protein [Candidatus Babeliales bacterium]
MQPINFIDPVPPNKQRSIALWYIISCASLILTVTVIVAIQTMQLTYLHKLEKKFAASKNK